MASPDSDLSRIGRLSAEVAADYTSEAPDRWAASPFQWISTSASARKGAVGKKLVRRWAEQEGFAVASKSGAGHDFTVGSVRVAIKLSLVWADGGFVFEQIRDQPYDVVGMLALEPERVRLWIVPKTVMSEHAGGQHTGSQGSETKWLHIASDDPPAWLSPYGGSLAQAKRALEQARGDRAA